MEFVRSGVESPGGHGSPGRHGSHSPYRYQPVPSTPTWDEESRIHSRPYVGVPPHYINGGFAGMGVVSHANSKDLGDVDLKGSATKPSQQQQDRNKKLKQAQLKTSVFDTYAVCAALLASFSCSVSYENLETFMNAGFLDGVCIGLQQILIRVCTIGAIHAMIIFMFTALYIKSALARNTYALEVYEKFCKETSTMRSTAFWIMYYTTLLFCVQVSLSTFISFPHWIAAPVCIAMSLGVFFVSRDSQRIIKAAGCVFMTDEALQAMFEEEAYGPSDRSKGDYSVMSDSADEGL